ncbi:MAG: hypothetical protein ACFB50_01465, partial [Rubrobacteraceae bacterium]
KCGEEGVHVEHEESVPFPSGSVSKPTLERGHLPLKSRTDNSHQTFKEFPILDAVEAYELLESGQISGNVVLLAPAWLEEENRKNKEIEHESETTGG